jgi:hypothetical protein
VQYGATAARPSGLVKGGNPSAYFKEQAPERHGQIIVPQVIENTNRFVTRPELSGAGDREGVPCRLTKESLEFERHRRAIGN